MRWPWSPPEPKVEATEVESGQHAREQAQSHLDEVQSRWPEVHRVSRSLRDLRERNHFADQIQNIFEGGPRP